jgi:hypothetical protein
MTSAPDKFLDALRSFPALPGVFNPWRDIDPVYDIGAESPVTRAEHLYRYISERIGRARIILCAEALGYQGGHFSGIAMTSERILLGHHVTKGVLPADVFSGLARRTSRVTPKTPANGFNEPTATVVWSALKKAGVDTRDVVLWNAFAPHPMNGPGAWLTNRPPTPSELRLGEPLLKQFLAMFPHAKTIAVGDVSERVLGNLGVTIAGKVRHPAKGGATKFREGVAELLRH